MNVIDRKRFHLDKIKLKKLLEKFYNETSNPVSIYLDEYNCAIYSEKGWPEFCCKICDDLDSTICCGLFRKFDEIQVCAVGLGCLPISIIIDSRCVGYLIIGHRRIIEYESHARINLDKQLYEARKNRFEKIRFIELYEKVELVTMNELNNLSKKDEVCRLLNSITIELIVTERLADIENRLLTSAAKITHLISQPLQALIGDAENLYNEIDNVELKEMAQNLRDELIKQSYNTCPLNNLNYMDVTPRYQFKKVDAIKLLRDIAMLFRRQAEGERGVEILSPVIKTTPPIDLIEASEPHIRQIIYNLISNAVKYSFKSTDRTHRYIEINCKSDKNYFIIELINFGIGILEKEIKDGLIYIDGYRGELTTDRSRTGAGIGLGVVKKYAEDHGGKIEIFSEKLGDGIKVDPYKTTVRVYLPFTQRRY